MEPTLPTIHMNGTSAEELRDGYAAACDALNTALEALQAARPNRRDYHTRAPEVWAAASKEHERRMHRLADTKHELITLHEHCAAAADARAARRQVNA